MASLRHTTIWAPLTLALLLLGGCGAGGPKLFWEIDEGSGKTAPTQHDLTVPPKNGTDLYQPPGDDEANADPVGADTGSSVAAGVSDQGRSSSGRRWAVVIADSRSVAEVWPVLVDAAIDLPLTNIDSVGHILTTDWVSTTNSQAVGVLGGPATPQQARYVLGVEASIQGSTIRVIAFSQARAGSSWINTKVAERDLQPMLDTLTRHGWTLPSSQS